jgi:hypothetical protein
MQRELEAVIRAIGTTANGRANVQAIMQEILYAIQRHDLAIGEADRRLLEALERAISGTHQVEQERQAPRYDQAYANGAWGPYNG